MRRSAQPRSCAVADTPAGGLEAAAIGLLAIGWRRCRPARVKCSSCRRVACSQERSAVDHRHAVGRHQRLPSRTDYRLDLAGRPGRRRSRTLRIELKPESLAVWARYLPRDRVPRDPRGCLARRSHARRARSSTVPGSLGVAVYEDGVLLKDLSALSLSVTAGAVYAEPSEAMPAILMIDADAPSRDMREQLVRNRNVATAAQPRPATARLPDLRQLPVSFTAVQLQRHVQRGTMQTVPLATGPADDVATLDLLGRCRTSSCCLRRNCRSAGSTTLAST